LRRLDASAPATNPSWTAIVSQAAPVLDRLHSARSCGTTAEAENHVVIASTTTSRADRALDDVSPPQTSL
jgi:hypothetical protein